MLDQYTEQPAPPDSTLIDDPARAIRLLEQRLERGWGVIANAELRGEPVAALYSHFEDLLRQYEALYDQHAAA